MHGRKTPGGRYTSIYLIYMHIYMPTISSCWKIKNKWKFYVFSDAFILKINFSFYLSDDLLDIRWNNNMQIFMSMYTYIFRRFYRVCIILKFIILTYLPPFTRVAIMKARKTSRSRVFDAYRTLWMYNKWQGSVFMHLGPDLRNIYI